MSWRDIARKDVHDASRSWSMWVLSALLLVVFVGYAATHAYLGEMAFVAFLDGLAGVVGILLPLIAVLLSYKSVAAERTSGSVYLSLSLPHSRKDMVVGKFIGRSVVLLVPTLVALAAAGVAGAARYGTDGAILYPWFLLVTVLYGVAFVGIALGVSMSTTVDRRITFGALGSYLLLALTWDEINSAVLVILHRFDVAVLADMPDWALLFRLLKPAESYYRLLRIGFDIERAGRYVADGAPLYVDWWMAAVLLCAWITVPLALGYWRFTAADL